MPRKRAEMQPYEVDQITQRMRSSRLRVDPLAVTDIVSWLLMHQQRYMRQAASLCDAVTHGADCAAGADYAAKASHVLADLISRINDTWLLRDWHEAQREVCAAMTRATTPPASEEPEGG